MGEDLEETHIGDEVEKAVEDPVVPRCGLTGGYPEQVGDDVSCDLEVALLHP